jgi:hypothetical protein
MNKNFIYCFFKYVHSVRLGESLNVGILALFPEDNTMIFKYPNDLQRLKCTYFDFNEDQLKAYLKSFDNKAKELSNSLINTTQWNSIDVYFEDLIKKEFLQDDEGALQFSHVRKAVKYSDNLDEIVEDLYFSYFEHYYEPAEILLKKSPKEFSKRDDQYILETLERYITAEAPTLGPFDFIGRNIQTDNISVRFDLEWLDKSNGRIKTHLVKPLSLDYRNNTTIQERAHSLHSKLHILDKEAVAENSLFDVMVLKPRLSKHEQAYYNALSILKESSNKTTVFEEDDYMKYSKTVARALLA